MVYIGNDIIEIERIRHFVLRHKEGCLGRVFTEKEWHYCWNKFNPFPSLATRFAAKEAVAKAFGTGIGQALKWTSVEILVDSLGCPFVQLDTLGQKFMHERSIKSISISLSHCRTYALATACLVKSESIF